MRYLRILKYFMLSSAQTDLAYRANFAIGLLNSVLNLIVGVLGLVVLFVVGSSYWTHRLARRKSVKDLAAGEKLRSAGITVRAPNQTAEYEADNQDATGSAAPQQEVQQ